jgi:murein DD-endopeptidase MepM/ murein hydrolase activator NlpD/biotin carboxyl carrier protein
MNYDYLPQPPEGVLDPKIPWSRINPNSRLWLVLKSKLTGRRQGDEFYSSYVNLSDADADKLIANMKKDPRGYPSLDQTSGTPVQWMERQRLYQEWLVEAYLENPFREDVNKKIEAAEQERRLLEIQEQRKKEKEEKEEREKRKKEREQIKPPETSVPAPVAPAPVEPASVPAAPAPAAPEARKPKPAPLRDEDLVAPYRMPSNVSKAMASYGDALDAIGNQLSKQNSILTRNLGYLRRINEDLGDVEFLLGQMTENYQEALDDFETEERKKALRKKIVGKIFSPFGSGKEPPSKVKPKQEKKQNWFDGITSFFNPSKRPEKKLASGGIALGQTGGDKVIPPGVYDNPIRGRLAPGTVVVPHNRNDGKRILNQYDQQSYIQSFGDVLAKSSNALLGSAVVVYGSVLRSLGPLAGYFNTSISGLIPTVSSILSISRSAVIDMFGGPAYAGTTENTQDLKSFYKSWRVYMNDNDLYFPGATGVFGGAPLPSGEIAEDIGIISSAADLRYVGGTNVNKLPAWIPFSKEDTKKIGYVSGFGYRWGRQHSGIDLDGDPGIKIISPFAGTVYDINKNWPADGGGGYGNLVGIAHDQPKIFTFYGHLKDVATNLEMGSKVKAGEVIGTVGNTGRSFGPHLHWEVRTQASGGQIDPVEWTHQNKPSFAVGGWFKPLVNLVRNVTRPKGLSIRGVQAGFTGMAREGFEAIMKGDKFRLGKWKPQILGRGAYSAPTLKGAQRYAGAQGSLGGKQTPGGVVKSIVPGTARRIDILEPQAAVKPATFDKGKLLADKLLQGAYANSPLANNLRLQLITGSAQNVGVGMGKLFSKAIGILNAPVIGDMLFPEPTAAGTLDYARSQGWVTPQSSKPPVKQTTIQMPPSSANVSPAPRASSKPQFVNIDIPTGEVLTTTQMRRM